jgi:hypothetical protein
MRAELNLCTEFVDITLAHPKECYISVDKHDITQERMLEPCGHRVKYGPKIYTEHFFKGLKIRVTLVPPR